MIVLALTLAAAGPPPMQILAGKAFENLAERTDVSCPARNVRSITPGDLDLVQEEFESKLSQTDRDRLRSANLSERRCAGRDGLSCPTTATLEAMEKVGLGESFAIYICTHPNS